MSFHIRYWVACMSEYRRMRKRWFYEWSYFRKHHAEVEDFAAMYNAGGDPWPHAD